MSQPGGFLVTADDVVQPFHLPTNIHKISLSTGDNQSDHAKQTMAADGSILAEESLTHGDGDLVTNDDPVLSNRPIDLVPKTMRELAEHHARLEEMKRKEGSFPDPAAAGPSSISVDTRKKTTRRNNSQHPSDAAPLSRPKQAQSSRKRTRRANDSGDEAKTSPSKRARGRNSGAVDTAPPTRVLRPRAPKSTAKVLEEHEMEEAYRQAVEE